MLQMRPMTQTEFREYRERAARGYARDLIESGQSEPDEADERALACIDTLLPDGLLTDDQVLLTLRESGDGVVLGHLWYGVVTEGPHRTLFIYDLEIEPAFRRQGWATRVLQALEDDARQLRVSEIGLSVFNHNTAALALYSELGFAAATTTFVKSIEPL
ncbi:MULTISPECIES: GNAT family N-acetyltransferase [Burkholderia]|uniref:GNAT family N-acetyltransferase n=1 Tax=Burkholderia TaxID=32008 RepID=UPI00075A952A|nr:MULTISPECIES: GNAT family N-acetyltransferase [Burkholderia]AOJ72373.1 GCN5 family acetyltransferase [Burkholderia savannae]KVG46301.1 GCN5 family acetyltransferase [Burkholderia sp. MSMB0265]KVG89552.1 GCN5 family acetyltransferase [Burkholderia sp. MSMB2040]KVG95801.1 GCN5 family acetyltransferase [Burkholderia sp. MSMB2041]KVH00787.1 GCN5 family acetyltransferase [Burkholderia sp. MSMB2042]